jgi:hypothetical protein
VLFQSGDFNVGHHFHAVEKFGYFGLEALLYGFEDFPSAKLDQKHEQVLFTAEVIEHHSLGDAGLMGDIADGGFPVPVAAEYMQCGVDDMGLFFRP